MAEEAQKGQTKSVAVELAAGEAARVVREVVEDFETHTPGRVPNGVVVVTDAIDDLPVRDVRAYCDFVAQREHDRKGALSEAELAKRWESLLKESKKVDAKASLVLMVKSVAVDATDLAGALGMPPDVADHAAWGMIVPTEAALGALWDRALAATLRGKKVGVLERALLAPLVPIVKPIMVGLMGTTRHIKLFQQFLDLQSGWTAAQQEAYLDAYLNRWKAGLSPLERLLVGAFMPRMKPKRVVLFAGPRNLRLYQHVLATQPRTNKPDVKTILKQLNREPGRECR